MAIGDKPKLGSAGLPSADYGGGEAVTDARLTDAGRLPDPEAETAVARLAQARSPSDLKRIVVGRPVSQGRIPLDLRDKAERLVEAAVRLDQEVQVIEQRKGIFSYLTSVVSRASSGKSLAEKYSDAAQAWVDAAKAQSAAGQPKLTVAQSYSNASDYYAKPEALTKERLAQSVKYAKLAMQEAAQIPHWEERIQWISKLANSTHALTSMAGVFDHPPDREAFWKMEGALALLEKKHLWGLLVESGDLTAAHADIRAAKKIYQSSALKVSAEYLEFLTRYQVILYVSGEFKQPDGMRNLLLYIVNHEIKRPEQKIEFLERIQNYYEWRGDTPDLERVFEAANRREDVAHDAGVRFLAEQSRKSDELIQRHLPALETPERFRLLLDYYRNRGRRYEDLWEAASQRAPYLNFDEYLNQAIASYELGCRLAARFNRPRDSVFTSIKDAVEKRKAQEMLRDSHYSAPAGLEQADADGSGDDIIITVVEDPEEETQFLEVIPGKAPDKRLIAPDLPVTAKSIAAPPISSTAIIGRRNPSVTRLAPAMPAEAAHSLPEADPRVGEITMILKAGIRSLIVDRDVRAASDLFFKALSPTMDGSEQESMSADSPDELFDVFKEWEEGHTEEPVAAQKAEKASTPEEEADLALKKEAALRLLASFREVLCRMNGVIPDRLQLAYEFFEQTVEMSYTDGLIFATKRLLFQAFELYGVVKQLPEEEQRILDLMKPAPGAPSHVETPQELIRMLEALTAILPEDMESAELHKLLQDREAKKAALRAMPAESRSFERIFMDLMAGIPASDSSKKSTALIDMVLNRAEKDLNGNVRALNAIYKGLLGREREEVLSALQPSPAPKSRLSWVPPGPDDIRNWDKQFSSVVKIGPAAPSPTDPITKYDPKSSLIGHDSALSSISSRTSMQIGWAIELSGNTAVRRPVALFPQHSETRSSRTFPPFSPSRRFATSDSARFARRSGAVSAREARPSMRGVARAPIFRVR